MAPPNEVRADPIEVCRVADQMLHSSTDIDDAWRAQRGAFALPADAFGDSHEGPGLSKSAQAAVDDAGFLLGRLEGVLQGDMDRLYRIAFAYQKADIDAANKYHPPHRNGPI